MIDNTKEHLKQFADGNEQADVLQESLFWTSTYIQGYSKWLSGF
jgi:hypothetical protein